MKFNIYFTQIKFNAKLRAYCKLREDSNIIINSSFNPYSLKQCFIIKDDEI